MPNNSQKGTQGEEIAVAHLLKNGYQILEKNWRSGHLEIDVVASNNQYLVVVEVKLRASDAFGRPEDFVTKSKQKKLIKAAAAYITENNINCETRFDVISILKNENRLELEHIEAAFYPGL